MIYTLVPTYFKRGNRRFWEYLKGKITWLIHYILPHHCYTCGIPTTTKLCFGCQGDLRVNTHGCKHCDLPMTPSPSDAALREDPDQFQSVKLNQLSETATSHLSKPLTPPVSNNIDFSPLTCPECIIRPPTFDTTHAAFIYTGALPFIMHQFKSKGATFWAKELSGELITSITKQNSSSHNQLSQDKPLALVPVPLHWTRRFTRGYNQSELIAHALSKTLNIPIMPLISKTNATKKQQNLTRKKRLQNLQNSFQIDRPLRNQKLPKYIALVDDVMTTGATMETLAQLLKSQGVERIDIWVLARTPKS